jgi:hypothetical protein
MKKEFSTFMFLLFIYTIQAQTSSKFCSQVWMDKTLSVDNMFLQIVTEPINNAA